jgi:hypothetical protein
MACDIASAVWLLNRVDEIEVIERNIRQKVVGPDFGYPMQDGQLSLARVFAPFGGAMTRPAIRSRNRAPYLEGRLFWRSLTHLQQFAHRAID